MPTEADILKIKEALKQEAREKFPNDEQRQQRYIWGTIQNIKKRRHL